MVVKIVARLYRWKSRNNYFSSPYLRFRRVYPARLASPVANKVIVNGSGICTGGSEIAGTAIAPDRPLTVVREKTGSPLSVVPAISPFTLMLNVTLPVRAAVNVKVPLAFGAGCAGVKIG